MSKRNFFGQEQNSPAQALGQEEPSCRVLFLSPDACFSRLAGRVQLTAAFHGQCSFLGVSRGQCPSLKDFLPEEELPFPLQMQSAAVTAKTQPSAVPSHTLVEDTPKTLLTL